MIKNYILLLLSLSFELNVDRKMKKSRQAYKFTIKTGMRCNLYVRQNRGSNKFCDYFATVVLQRS